MSSEELIQEAQNPSTTPARLAELAAADRGTWPAIAGNPNAYEGLLEWLGERDVPSVNEALAARAARDALPPIPPPAAPAPPAPPAPAAPVEAAAPAEPAPVEPAPVEPAPVEPAAPVAEQPTVEAPAAETPVAEPVVAAEPVSTPAPEPTPEPTVVIPTAQPTYPGAEPTAATAAFGAAPPTEGTPSATSDDGGSGSGKPLGVVIAVVALVIALIGGGAWAATEVFGDDESPGANPRPVATIEAPTAAAPTEDAPTTPAPAPTSEAPAASSDFCTTMKDIQDSSLDVLDSAGSTPNLDSLQKMADDMISSYKSLESSAPDELKADVKVMASYFELLSNPTADSASKMSESISDYSKAAQKVGLYYAQNCL